MPIDPSEIEIKPQDISSTPPITEPEQVEEDFILRTVSEDESPDNILKAVMEGLAEEQAALRSLRKKKQLEGADISHISVKRGTLLKYMSETILQRKSISGSTEEINLKGIKFREVFKLFLKVISETFDEVKIPDEYKEMFFHKLGSNLNGWEDKAERAIKAIEAPK